MATTNSVTAATPATSSTATTSSSSTDPTGGMDKDAFLKLLMTQIQYQDPMQPMDNTQFVAQLAQFSSLEQMQQVSTHMGVMSAAGLLGHSVTTQDPTSGSKVSGTVTGVTFNNNEPFLEINGQTLNSAWLTSIDK